MAWEGTGGYGGGHAQLCTAAWRVRALLLRDACVRSCACRVLPCPVLHCTERLRVSLHNKTQAFGHHPRRTSLFPTGPADDGIPARRRLPARFDPVHHATAAATAAAAAAAAAAAHTAGHGASEVQQQQQQGPTDPRLAAVRPGQQQQQEQQQEDGCLRFRGEAAV